MERFRAELDSGNVFESLVQRYFIDNPHQLVFTMLPDAGYTAKLEQDEQQRLKTRVEALDDGQKQQIFHDGQRLAQLQEQKQGASSGWQWSNTLTVQTCLACQCCT
jgi:Zn-dependent M16 (insulinase) family peptidase